MKFNFDLPFHMHISGLFTTTNTNWIHDTRACDSYEIFYMTKGTLYIGERDHKYILHPGDYLITPPTKHQYGWKPSACSFYWFHFYHTEEFTTPEKGTFDHPQIIENYAALLTFVKEQSLVGDHLITALLYELQHNDHHETGSAHNSLCNSIQKFVKAAPADQLKISSLAEQFGYNKKYLSHCFCNETGISLKQYLTNEMMHRAEYLLTSTPLTISQISESLGYPDAHTFSHAFKREHEVSPKEYRRKELRLGLNDR